MRKRSKVSWTITLTLGRKIDPKTGKSKVNQKVFTVRGTKAEAQVWDEVEVRKFLLAAREAGVEEEAFYTLAIETGMRKGELCGLKWEDVDFVARRISVKRTLIKAGPEPILGPPKVGRSRAVAISPQMASLLKRHRIKQSEFKLCLGDAYTDQNFVFTKENGDPLQINNFAQRSFADLIERAGVKKIRFHDLRHTCATLLLANEVNPKIDQERLGHSDISMTLNRYSHVTPTMQDRAAQILGDAMEI